MKKSAATGNRTSDQIDTDVEAFLKQGGKIEKIDNGVSGYQQSKHIVISSAKKTAAKAAAAAAAATNE
jgi:hypothetical protein